LAISETGKNSQMHASKNVNTLTQRGEQQRKRLYKLKQLNTDKQITRNYFCHN